jgi:hypothetical protein
LNATTPSAAANCKNDRGMVVCETRNPNGIFVDIHPHATTVDFYIDVYLSECGLDGVKYYAPFSVSQESRRYTTHRFNQATIVHWNWRPLRPCWQAFVKDCKVGNQSRPCNQVLDVNGVLVP